MTMKRAILSAMAGLMAAVMTIEAQTSGNLSKNISWTLADSVLTISGSGKMPGYNSTSISKLPWSDERMAASVKKIVIEEGITEIGAYCFGARAHSRSAREAKSHTYYNTQDATTTAHFLNIDEIVLPSTLTKIGHHAFVRMPVTHICFPEGLKEICAGAFSNSALQMVVLPAQLTHLGSEAFGDCLNLQAVDFRGLPLAISSGTFFGDDRLRLLTHTYGIKSVNLTAFDASTLTKFSPEEILQMFHSDGVDYHLSLYVPARENFPGDDSEYDEAVDKALDVFYNNEASNATSFFELDRFRLSDYDEKNSTFTISTVNHGKLLMHVDADAAPTFSARWPKLAKMGKPVYKPDNGRVKLQSINYTIGDRTFVAAPIQ